MQTKEKDETRVPNGSVDDHAPKQLTLAQNAILTIKVLAIAGLILASIWGVNQWTSPK
jgi:hypothetical protein